MYVCVRLSEHVYMCVTACLERIEFADIVAAAPCQYFYEIEFCMVYWLPTKCIDNAVPPSSAIHIIQFERYYWF